MNLNKMIFAIYLGPRCPFIIIILLSNAKVAFACVSNIHKVRAEHKGAKCKEHLMFSLPNLIEKSISRVNQLVGQVDIHMINKTISRKLQNMQTVKMNRKSKPCRIIISGS